MRSSCSPRLGGLVKLKCAVAVLTRNKIVKRTEKSGAGFFIVSLNFTKGFVKMKKYPWEKNRSSHKF